MKSRLFGIASLPSALTAAALFAAATPVAATTFTFNDFSDTTGLTLNGSATTTTTSDGTVLRLTPALTGQSGSTFSSATINAASFSTKFQFRISNRGGSLFDCNTVTGADGIVFVAQSVSSSIGGGGAGIGYAGIGSSVGVEFDTWCNAGNNDPSSNHIGVVTNGNVNHSAGAPNTVNVSPDFDDGNLRTAWIDYDGGDLEIHANQTGIRPTDALLTVTVDIPALLGQDTAFVGFTSGTGADFGDHDILNWEYRDSFAPVDLPAPPALAVFALGLAALAVRRRRG
jgi:hypothetical protein